MQKQERSGDKRQQISVAEAKLNLNLALYVLDAAQSVKFLSHCVIKPDLSCSFHDIPFSLGIEENLKGRGMQ